MDHGLAKELWASGNHDARVLATLVADGSAFDERTLESWAKSLDNYVIADMFARAVAESPFAQRKMEKWTASAAEFTGQAGWNLVAALAMQPGIPDAEFERYLETIESRIHTAKNRVRHAMNSALIAIGGRSAAMEKKAIAVAKRIGEVEVDHGETGCRTPAAIPCIRKMRARAKERKK
jgi:3-methyladenine DNA glycosylase AlkD